MVEDALRFLGSGMLPLAVEGRPLGMTDLARSGSSSGPDSDLSSSDGGFCPEQPFVSMPPAEQDPAKVKTYASGTFEESLSPFVRLSRRVLRRGGGARDERRVVRVDVGGLDGDERLDVLRSRAKSFAEEFRDDLDELGVEARVSLELLRSVRTTSALLTPPSTGRKAYVRCSCSCGKSS